MKDDEYYYFLDYAHLDELTDNWSIVDYQSGYFSATTFKRGNNIIIAYRGTNDGLIEWADNVLCYGLVDYHTEEVSARNYATKIYSMYPNCNIYITGHSLGGYLAQIGTAEMIAKGHSDALSRVAYFNGIGMKYNKLIPIAKDREMFDLYNYSHDKLKENGKLISYSINGDWVHMLGTHCGSSIGYNATEDAIKNHCGEDYKDVGQVGFWESVGIILKNAGVTVLGTGVAAVAASPTVLYWYAYYHPTTFLEYTWITHETDSFFYYLK